MISGWLAYDRAADLGADIVAHALGLPAVPALKQQPTARANPLEEDAFEGILKQLFGSLLRAVEPEDRRALQTVQTMLDLDWPGMSDAERERAITKLGVALGGVPSVVVQKVDKVLALQGPQIVLATKQASAATFDLPISPSFNLVDKRVIEAARRSHAHYVRNEYGVRQERASAVARKIVARGMEQGLDKYAIAEELQPAMEALGVNRSRGYFRMVASVYAARARSWGQIAAFDEAAIEYMEWVSVLDESTSNVCRFLDGKVFPVAAARARHEQVAASEDPESVADLQPWVSSGKAENGAEALYYKQEGKRIPIATVERSGVGAKDDRGEFARGASVDKLIKAGITSPPAHAHCRSLVVPASSPGASAQVPANAPVGPLPAPPPGKILPYISFPTEPVIEGPAADWPDLITQVRPVRAMPLDFNPEALPQQTPEELAAIAAEEAKRKAIQEALQKLAALPKPSQGAVASPLPTVVSLGPGWMPPKPNKVKVAGGKKKKPVPVALDHIHGLNNFQEKSAKAAVELFDPNEPVLLVKQGGVFTPLTATENYKLLAAKLHGHTTVPSKVIDLDKAASKKPKKAPAPPVSQPPDTLPSPPPAPPRPPTLSAPPPKGDAKNILFKQTGAKQGSNEGGFYEGADGVARYVKFYEEKGKAECEHLANALYRDLGHTAPESVLFEHNGKVAFASKIIPGAKTLREIGHSAERSKKILEGFVADVLTANWDVVGVGNSGGDDNVVFLPDGSVARIDNGGSLLMRGLTGRKPDWVLNQITEWDKLFDPGVNLNYSRMAKAAGVTSAEDMKDVVLAGIDKVLALEKAAGGWSAYVDRLVPGLASSDRARIAEMLTARAKLLADKAVELRKPPPAPLAPGQARFVAKQYSTVLPRAGLKLSDLPEAAVIEDHYKKINRQSPDRMPSGEKYSEYRKRADAAVKGMGSDGLSGIRSFTGTGYDDIRASEERGAPDHRSDAIQKALAKGTPEPGTVWRGIHRLPEFVITKHLENGILQLGKKGGSTSSSSWLIDVSIDSFMDGPGDGHPGSYKILYKLNGKTQVPVETISSVGDTERELMFGRDAVFRVTGLSRPKGRKHVLVVEAEELVGAERDAALGGGGGGGVPPVAPTPPTPPATPKDKAAAKLGALPTKPGPKGLDVMHGLESFSATKPPPVHPSNVSKEKVEEAKAKPHVLVSPSMITMAADSVPYDNVADAMEDAVDGDSPPLVLVQSGGKLYLKTPQIWGPTVVAHAQAGTPIKAHVVNLDAPDVGVKSFPPVTAEEKTKGKTKLAALVETAPGKVTHPAASSNFTPSDPVPIQPSAIPQKKVDAAKQKPPTMIDPAAVTLWGPDVNLSSLQIAIEHLPTNGVVIPLIKAKGKLYPMKQMYDAVVGGLHLLGKPVLAHIIDMDAGP